MDPMQDSSPVSLELSAKQFADAERAAQTVGMPVNDFIVSAIREKLAFRGQTHDNIELEKAAD
jgi:uncharacterized protein (DUF1778 family)